MKEFEYPEYEKVDLDWDDVIVTSDCGQGVTEEEDCIPSPES